MVICWLDYIVFEGKGVSGSDLPENKVQLSCVRRWGLACQWVHGAFQEK